MVQQLSLEGYVRFIEDPQSWKEFTTRSQLNQIIRIHGFCGLYAMKKDDMIRELRKIELLTPGRSTLESDISPLAYFSREEMDRDLIALKWQECQLQSVKSLNPPPSSNDKGAIPDLPVLVSLENSRSRLEKTKTKKKPRKISAMEEANSAIARIFNKSTETTEVLKSVAAVENKPKQSGSITADEPPLSISASVSPGSSASGIEASSIGRNSLISKFSCLAGAV